MKKKMRLRLPSRLIIALCALALAACAAFKVGYNNLDWFVSWQAGKYVDLGGPQQALLERGVESLWRWHRSTQLKLYARDLRELAETTTPLSRAQVENYLERSNQHVERAVREAMPELVKVIRAMDDAQIAEVLENVSEKREARAEEQAELSVEEQQELAAKKMLKNWKRWLGSASREQKQRIETWAASRQYGPALWQTYYQKKWTDAFAAALASRQQAEFPERLGKLFLEPGTRGDKAIQALQAHNRRAWVDLMSDLSGTLSAAQRRHFQGELRDLIGDLEALQSEAS